ncbi:MAG: hypothetical protein ACE14P_15550 [Methanotrichaceae archaeon]
MRSASVLMAAVIILLLCLSVHAQYGDPGDIAVPSIPAPNMDMPNPVVSRPNMDIQGTKPAPLVKPGSIKPNSDLNPASNQTSNKGDNGSSDKAQTTQTEQESKAMDINGKWSIRFDDGADRSLDLTLWPSAGSSGIMGFGTLTEMGAKNTVTVSGSLTDQELKLTAKLAVPEHAGLKYDECDLDLHAMNDTLSGTYVLRHEGQFLVKGNATAEMAPTT